MLHKKRLLPQIRAVEVFEKIAYNECGISQKKGYDFMENIIENALRFVEEIFKTDYSGHDYFHTLRVFKMATNIAIKEMQI